MSKLTQERLKEVLSYDPDTGLFTWTVTKSWRAVKGKIAGVINERGYVKIQIDMKIYRGHRLAWLYMYGDFPKYGIDHINGNRADNRICNLREATDSQNQQNRTIQKNNSSGYAGVFWSKNMRRWTSRIQANYIAKSLGYYDTPEEAYAAYCKAKLEIHTFNPFVRSKELSPKYAR